jgi:hypothetical protein
MADLFHVFELCDGVQVFSREEALPNCDAVIDDHGVLFCDNDVFIKMPENRTAFDDEVERALSQLFRPQVMKQDASKAFVRVITGVKPKRVSTKKAQVVEVAEVVEELSEEEDEEEEEEMNQDEDCDLVVNETDEDEDEEAAETDDE